MIAVCVVIGVEGNLVSASAEGHAKKGSNGSDIVCAAVTVLLRTTLATIASRTSLVVDAKTAGHGTLAFRVTAWQKEDVPFLHYAAAFLLEGITSLQREYPEAVSMRVETEIDY